MSEDIFPSPISAHQMSLDIAAGRNLFKLLVLFDIGVGMEQGFFTSSSDTTGVSAAEVLYVIGLLNKMNYVAYIDQNALIVSW